MKTELVLKRWEAYLMNEENERKRRSEVVHIVNREVEPINKD